MTLLGQILTEVVNACVTNAADICFCTSRPSILHRSGYIIFKDIFSSRQCDEGGHGPVLMSNIPEFRTSHSSQICIAHSGILLEDLRKVVQWKQ